MKSSKYWVASFVMSSVLITSSCGTLLYPERQGQSGGRVDPSIAIFNGIGLLLFVIPGLVAFAVDFHTGAIYLPNSSAGVDFDSQNLNLSDKESYKQIGVLKNFSERELEAIIEQKTSVTNVLQHSDLMVIDTSNEKRISDERFAENNINYLKRL